MSDNKDSISWTQFSQAMNSIAYWLLQNKKKYQKRDYYQILKESKEVRYRQASSYVHNGINQRQQVFRLPSKLCDIKERSSD